MGLLSRLRTRPDRSAAPWRRSPDPGGRPVGAAVDRYRHLLQRVRPDALEEMHAEAFAALAPRQRHLVFEKLSHQAAVPDRPAGDDPRTLAHSAVRSEARTPGFLERTLGPCADELLDLDADETDSTSLLESIARAVVGSTIANVVVPGVGDVAAPRSSESVGPSREDAVVARRGASALPVPPRFVF